MFSCVFNLFETNEYIGAIKLGSKDTVVRLTVATSMGGFPSWERTFFVPMELRFLKQKFRSIDLLWF